TPLPLKSTLFPYTTLFRSNQRARERGEQMSIEIDRRPLRPYERALIHVAETQLWDRSIHESLFDAVINRGVTLTGFSTPDQLVRSEEHTSELQSLAYLVCR